MGAGRGLAGSGWSQRGVGDVAGAIVQHASAAGLELWVECGDSSWARDLVVLGLVDAAGDPEAELGAAYVPKPGLDAELDEVAGRWVFDSHGTLHASTLAADSDPGLVAAWILGCITASRAAA